MAARSGAGVGVIVALVVFIFLTIAMLVMSIVFYSNQTKAQEEAATAARELDRFATSLQRSGDDFRASIDAAQGRGESVLAYMQRQQADIMQKVTGQATTPPSELGNRLQTAGVGANQTVVSALSDLRNGLNAAQSEARNRAEQVATLQQTIAERDRQLEQAERRRQQEVQAVRDLLASYEADVERYRNDVLAASRGMSEGLDRIAAQYTERIAGLQRMLDDQRATLALRDAQLQEFRAIIDQSRLRPSDPAQLADGEVLGNAEASDLVFINRGRRDKIVVGMTFEVYDDAASIGIDAQGNLTRGKASLQVVSLSETTATARITRSSPGRPVVRGDQIANAVYDPNKTYTFLVHGLFDLDGDGVPTESEAELVRSFVRQWGGEVVSGSQLRGDLDFLVLGVEPPRPGPLAANAPRPVVDRWMRSNEAFDNYQRLFREAREAGIPVLNHNRFLILIGHTGF